MRPYARQTEDDLRAAMQRATACARAALSARVSEYFATLALEMLDEMRTRHPALDLVRMMPDPEDEAGAAIETETYSRFDSMGRPARTDSPSTRPTTPPPPPTNGGGTGGAKVRRPRPAPILPSPTALAAFASR